MSSSIPSTPSEKDYANNPEVLDPLFERDDPFGLFADWHDLACAGEINDPNAMSVATVDDAGMPDVRIVLLKDFSEEGFVFYTNNNSTKGEQLKSNDVAALCFHWKSIRRQIRIRGSVSPVTAAESDAYFAGRARGSQIGAWASDQSSDLESRDVFEARIQEYEAKFDGQDVPRPPNWYGWRVSPVRIEFWRDRRFRLHDRLIFSRATQNERWLKSRLYP